MDYYGSAGNHSREKRLILGSTISSSGPRIIAVSSITRPPTAIDTRYHAFLSSTRAACSLPYLGSSGYECREHQRETEHGKAGFLSLHGGLVKVSQHLMAAE